MGSWTEKKRQTLKYLKFPFARRYLYKLEKDERDTLTYFRKNDYDFVFKY